MSRLVQIDGLPIVDSKRPITVHIIKPDITNASSQRPNDCAVARACRRELHALEVRIHVGRAYLRTNTSNWVRYLVPGSLRDEIVAFDRGGRFHPGEFVLDASAKAKRYRSDKSTTTRTGKKRRSPHVLTDVRTGPA